MLCPFFSSPWFPDTRAFSTRPSPNHRLYHRGPSNTSASTHRRTHLPILLALVALAAAAYLHLFCDIPTYTILLAWEVSTFAVCGYLAAADFFSTPRSEFVVEQLYHYGLRFSVLAMLGCLTEDTFGFGMRVICGGSLPHLFPLYDILVIMYLMRSIKRNDLKLEKKMVAAEKLGGRTSSLTT